MSISDDDRKAFEAATADVRPLKPKNLAEPETLRPKPRATFSRAARAGVLEESLAAPPSGDSPEEVAFRRDAVSAKNFRKLRRGEFAIEAEIDLHGMRLEEAHDALKQFLSECAARRFACVRVVHGKGTRSGPAGPILKPSVHHWLARWDLVMAFVSAQARHGGNGAVYVLIRSL